MPRECEELRAPLAPALRSRWTWPASSNSQRRQKRLDGEGCDFPSADNRQQLWEHDLNARTSEFRLWALLDVEAMIGSPWTSRDKS